VPLGAWGFKSPLPHEKMAQVRGLMVASDGGIFNFSDRPFSGSLGATRLPAPITSVAALP
jgi:hypothetical protein